MTDSDKIAIVSIVVNAAIGTIGWIVAWKISKKTNQTTLPAAKPVAKPKRKRRLTATERRFLKRFRVIQVFMLLIAAGEPLHYFLFNPFPPQGALDLISLVLSIGVMVGFSYSVILFEKNEIRQIKSGEFMKRMKQLAERGTTLND